MNYSRFLIIAIIVSSGALFLFHYQAVEHKEKPTVVCTTTIIADLVAHVAGDYVTVKTLMGPGVDPHLYRARESDISTLSNADLIFYNGLHLEGKMADVFEHMNEYVPTIALAQTLPEPDLLVSGFDRMYDPHVWHDVELFKQFVPIVVRALSTLDPQHADNFEKNGAVYVGELALLDDYAQNQIALIAVDRRVLVTAHDAFSYFGKRYGVRVVGLQGMSTDAQLTVSDMHDAIDAVMHFAVPAIFLESSIPAQSINALQHALQAQGHHVTIGMELFSDSLGDQGTTVGSYSGMIKHNVDSIVSALVN